ncbi:MAG: hypothetical protein OXU81_16220, partial [Gammaproteobacteria bacterium]|nr:hypothetical protein [Gammaproteobacteria bacterium]
RNLSDEEPQLRTSTFIATPLVDTLWIGEEAQAVSPLRSTFLRGRGGGARTGRSRSAGPDSTGMVRQGTILP